MWRAAFLDRDGVINRMVYDAEFGIVDSPANPDQLKLIPGVGEAIARLNRLGLLVVIISNQPGIAKGKFTVPLLDDMERKMLAGIQAGGGKVNAIYNCLHHPQADLEQYRVLCECRKPRPGLLLLAARELEIDLERSYMVGDGVTDVIAGRAAGTTTLFVSSRKCYTCDSLVERGVWPDYMAGDLREAVNIIEKLERGDTANIERFVARCEVARGAVKHQEG